MVDRLCIRKEFSVLLDELLLLADDHIHLSIKWRFAAGLAAESDLEIDRSDSDRQQYAEEQRVGHDRMGKQHAGEELGVEEECRAGRKHCTVDEVLPLPAGQTAV